jgi:hypothetical protein
MTSEFALNVAKPIKIDLYMTDYLPKNREPSVYNEYIL